MEADLGKTGPMSPSDIAVLVRFKGLIPPIKKRPWIKWGSPAIPQKR